MQPDQLDHERVAAGAGDGEPQRVVGDVSAGVADGDGDRLRYFLGPDGAQVAAVISNKADAGGLALAREQHIPTAAFDHKVYASREDFDAALMAEIDRYQPALVVLAGFMRILTPGFVTHYEGRLINIHPSLLPAFPGLHTHRRAIESGCRFAGCTVHRVTAELDHGEYLDQAVVPILPDDTPEALAARVLTQEHLIYPRVVERLLSS